MKKVAAVLILAMFLLSSQMDTVQSANSNCYDKCLDNCDGDNGVEQESDCDRICSNKCPPPKGNTNHGCQKCCRCCGSRKEKMSFENLKYQGGEYNVHGGWDNRSGGGGRGGGGSRGCPHGCCKCC